MHFDPIFTRKSTNPIETAVNPDITTPTGAKWSAMTVLRVRKRLAT